MGDKTTAAKAIPDQITGANIRREVEDTLRRLCATMTEAGRKGFVVEFNLGKQEPGDATVVTRLDILRRY